MGRAGQEALLQAGAARGDGAESLETILSALARASGRAGRREGGEPTRLGSEGSGAAHQAPGPLLPRGVDVRAPSLSTVVF